jgi:signal peptidase
MARVVVRGAGILMWIAASLLALLLAATFVPTLFGMQTLVVGSGSMGAAMPVGAVALTREVDARAVAVGDIISYRRRGAPVTTTHRVVTVKMTESHVVFTTKGDANATEDPQPVYVDHNIHRVEHVVPYAGYVARAARTPEGALGFLVIPLLGLTFDRGGRKRRRKAPDEEGGWSATTLSLIIASRLGSRPAG